MYKKSIFFITFFHFILLVNFSWADDLKQIVTDEAKVKVERYFNQIKYMECTFSQYEQSGAVRQGKIFVSKPNKMRVDYYTPYRESIILDGDMLMHYNHELDELSYIHNTFFPLRVLSQENISLENDLKTVALEHAHGRLTMEVTFKEMKDKENKFFISFIQKPFTLKSADVINSEGRMTLDFEDMSTNHPISDSTFEIDFSNRQPNKR